MSVIGWIASLTRLLIRASSFHALVFSVTSRGSDGPVAHSRGLSEQNSTHPIGAREPSPIETNSGRGLATALVANAIMQPAATIRMLSRILFEYRCTRDPFPCS